MAFRIQGLTSQSFSHLFGLSDAELASHGAERHQVQEANSAPCRVSLDDVEPGKTVLLISFQHQVSQTPYRQAGPIFVSESAAATWDASDVIPPALGRRVLSVRAFDQGGTMLEADICDGHQLGPLLEQFFAKPEVMSIDIHYARRGCFAARAFRG